MRRLPRHHIYSTSDSPFLSCSENSPAASDTHLRAKEAMCLCSSRTAVHLHLLRSFWRHVIHKQRSPSLSLTEPCGWVYSMVTLSRSCKIHTQNFFKSFSFPSLSVLSFKKCEQNFQRPLQIHTGRSLLVAQSTR